MNGTHENGIITYTAAADLSKGTIVKFTGSADSGGRPTVTPTTAENDIAIGAAIDECKAGDEVAIAILGSYRGTMLIKAAGAISRGAYVGPDGASRVLCSVNIAMIGVALDAATAAGDLIEITHCVPIVAS